MANVNTKAHVLVRDRFICRFCAAPVILAQAIKVLDWHVAGLDLWDAHGTREPLRSRWATVDHVKAEVLGGMDILENLVACCVRCNSQKGGGPAIRDIVDAPTTAWDGLSQIFLALAPEYGTRLSKEDNKWLAALRREGLKPSVDRIDGAVAALREIKSRGLEAFQAPLY